RASPGILPLLPAGLARIGADAEFQASESKRAIVVDLLGEAALWMVAGAAGRVSRQPVVLQAAKQLVNRQAEHLTFQVPQRRFDSGQDRRAQPHAAPEFAPAAHPL